MHVWCQNGVSLRLDWQPTVVGSAKERSPGRLLWGQYFVLDGMVGYGLPEWWHWSRELG
jgi:hypothetical protein